MGGDRCPLCIVEQVKRAGVERNEFSDFFSKHFERFLEVDRRAELERKLVEAKDLTIGAFYLLDIAVVCIYRRRVVVGETLGLDRPFERGEIADERIDDHRVEL